MVVISIDGFNPAYYQTNEFRAPNIQSLARRGATAQAVYPVFPSLTYPNHTALATGCRTDKHGVHTNVKLRSKAWHWFNSDIVVPTLWSQAKKAGAKVALLSWPVSTDAEVDFNIPEIFHIPGVNEGSTDTLLRQHSTPGLMERFEVVVPTDPKDFIGWDLETERVACGLLAEEPLDLIMIHLLQVDQAQHQYGPQGPEVQRAVLELDRIIGSIVKAAGPNATIAIVGDHGFRPYQKLAYLQNELRRAGLGEQAHVRATGGSAAIYTDSREVEELLDEELASVERVLSREELDYLEAFPGARFAVTAAEGYVFSYRASGATETKRTRGQHGHLPEEVPTGLVIVGPGIAAGTDLGALEIIHVAPTLAHLLGIKMPSAQGQSLLEDRPITRD